jgi:flagellar biogenesis protein FliO
MLAAGPRDVMVPASGAAAAREVLLQAELIEDEPAASQAVDSPARLLVGLLAFIALVGVIAWVGTEILG